MIQRIQSRIQQVISLRSYLTFLSRNKVYTAINVFGLSVSLLFVILLGVLVQQEYSVDDDIPNVDRIYGFGMKGGALFGRDSLVHLSTNEAWVHLLQPQVPAIEAVCGVRHHLMSQVRLSDVDKYVCDLLAVDSTFYQVFDFPLVQGDARHVFDTRDGAVISEQMACRLFGERNPMGRRLEFDTWNEGWRPVVVKGVFSTMGNTSIPTPDIIVQIGNMARGREIYIAGVSDVFILAKEGADMKAQAKLMEQLLQERMEQMCPPDTQVELVPLRGSYMNTATETFHARRGNARMVGIFGLAALVILLFSVMNYVNLTVAQSGYRAREMATRRLFGSQRWEIVVRLILESVALCLLSLAIALGLALWLAPYFKLLFGVTLFVNRLLLPQNMAMLLAVVLAIGIVAGVAPAVIQSRARPIEVVRGTFRRTTRMVFSRVFITIQNVITIVLIAAALTIYLQIRHMVNAPLGYNTHGILELSNSDPNWPVSTLTFRDELLKLPCVEQVGYGAASPLSPFSGRSMFDGRMIPFQSYSVDENWLKVFGITIAEDYHVDDANGVYVTPNLFSLFNLKPGTRQFYPWDPSEQNMAVTIRGVLSDFHLGDIVNKNGGDPNVALGLEVWPSGRMWDHGYVPQWCIKVRGDEAEAYRQVRELYVKTFHFDIYDPHPFLDQKLEDCYGEETQLLHVVTLFMLIAVLISLLGLVAMSIYFIQQRRKEIAMRKVFGSTSEEIRHRLMRSFLVYVVVAFVIAVPIVWHFVGDWLSAYSYRIALWPQMLAAGLVSLAISFLAVAIQSWMASNENPINHIKDNG